MGTINNASGCITTASSCYGAESGAKTKLNSSLNKMSFLQTHANQVCKCLPAPDLGRAA